MKRFPYSRTLPFLTAVCVLLLPCATSAQRWGANSPSPKPANGGASHSAETTYGDVTNGIRGGITVRQGGGQRGGPAISVFVTNSNPGELFQEKDHGTNWLAPFLKKVGNNDWLYYMATNSFCGPVELRDANGRNLRLLKPEVSQPDAYPARYSLSAEDANYLRRHHAYLGSGIFPLPLLGARSASELVTVDLAEYFDLRQSGEYLFTVWPKIYRRVPKSNDLCDRIDLPPVTVPINFKEWSASSPPPN